MPFNSIFCRYLDRDQNIFLLTSLSINLHFRRNWNSRTQQLMTAKSGRAMIKNDSRHERILATMAGGGRVKIEVEKPCEFISSTNEVIAAHLGALLKPIIITTND